MRFGLQEPIFSFDYSGQDTSQMVDSLEKLATAAEKNGLILFG
jgi:hypothetical protein